MQVPFCLRVGGFDQTSLEPIDLAAQLPRLASRCPLIQPAYAWFHRKGPPVLADKR
jgi:hypothetical protein